MNYEQFRRVADEEGILPTAYSIGGDYHDDQMVLRKEGAFWTVFYFERGARFDEHLYTKEDEAFEYLLKVLRRDPSAKLKR